MNSYQKIFIQEDHHSVETTFRCTTATDPDLSICEIINGNRPNTTCSSPTLPLNSPDKVTKNEKSDEDSISNANAVSSINLESDFIEAVIDEYKNNLTFKKWLDCQRIWTIPKNIVVKNNNHELSLVK